MAAFHQPRHVTEHSGASRRWVQSKTRSEEPFIIWGSQESTGDIFQSNLSPNKKGKEIVLERLVQVFPRKTYHCM